MSFPNSSNWWQHSLDPRVIVGGWNMYDSGLLCPSPEYNGISTTGNLSDGIGSGAVLLRGCLFWCSSLTTILWMVTRVWMWLLQPYYISCFHCQSSLKLGVLQEALKYFRFSILLLSHLHQQNICTCAWAKFC